MSRVHASAAELALWAGGDLPLWSRWRVSRHVARCAQCQHAAHLFHEDRTAVRLAAELPPADVDWERLAGEMKANIRVGLEAGECVGPVEMPLEPAPTWRTAVALASLVLVALTGWWLNVPRLVPSQAATVSGGDVVLEATSAGIELKKDGRAFTLVNARSDNNVTLSVSVQGGVRARYVDSDTGQVTINHVYLD